MSRPTHLGGLSLITKRGWGKKNQTKKQEEIARVVCSGVAVP